MYSVSWDCPINGEHRQVFSDDYMACAVVLHAMAEEVRGGTAENLKLEETPEETSSGVG